MICWRRIGPRPAKDEKTEWSLLVCRRLFSFFGRGVRMSLVGVPSAQISPDLRRTYLMKRTRHRHSNDDFCCQQQAPVPCPRASGVDEIESTHVARGSTGAGYASVPSTRRPVALTVQPGIPLLRADQTKRCALADNGLQSSSSPEAGRTCPPCRIKVWC
ncbi:hypothetical protein BKA81DRAFT_67625 [Phyllosticta paracitricarpa]